MAGSKGDKYYDVFLDYALWLKTIENKKILNQDGFILLIWIKKLGSIKLAANEIQISYRKAWNLINKSEKILGFKLVIKHRGGKDGGHTGLSPEGENLVNAYSDLKSDIDSSIKKVTKNFFHQLNQ
jgi:molybdate transport system regulatory protein